MDKEDFHKLNLLHQVRQRVGYSKIRIIDTTHEIVSKILFKLWPWDKDRDVVKIGLEYDPYYCHDGKEKTEINTSFAHKDKNNAVWIVKR